MKNKYLSRKCGIIYQLIFMCFHTFQSINEECKQQYETHCTDKFKPANTENSTYRRCNRYDRKELSYHNIAG